MMGSSFWQSEHEVWKKTIRAVFPRRDVSEICSPLFIVTEKCGILSPTCKSAPEGWLLMQEERMRQNKNNMGRKERKIIVNI